MRAILVTAVCAILGAQAAVPARRTLTPLDLEAKFNRKLTDNQGTGVAGNDLGALPTGRQTFAGIPFRIGTGLIQLGSTVLNQLPEKVDDIAVNRPITDLHILQATCFGGGPNRPGDAWFVPDGTLIGEYRVNFEDRSAVIIPILYGGEVRDWFFAAGEPEPVRSKVAWSGVNARVREVGAEGVRLYVTSWANPWPTKKVTTIEYTSKKDSTVAAPFCVAMTVAE